MLTMPVFSRFVPGVLLGLALLLAACDKSADAPARGAMQAVPVTTTHVREQPFVETVSAIGTVSARESVTVTAKVSEIVERVHFESGQHVTRGTPLVTLSGQQQQAALRAAEANAAEAERLYQRNRQLAEQQLIARASLDSQQAIRDSARAQVAQIRAQLGERVIRAPFSGVLGLRQVSPGALVSPGTPIATLDDVSRVWVDFPLPEARLNQLAIGQRLSGSSNAWPGRQFDGVVSTIDARIDPATRALTVRADFANADGALKPGMLIAIDLFKAERPALLAPEIAVMQVGRDTFVWKVDAENKVAQAPVELGQRVAGQVEITNGLEPGDRIVVDGVGKLRAGQTIRDTSEDPPATAAAGNDANATQP
ncbi:efflux RND transporter periplasmic adaptor subunit [Luteimonas sp. e5]